jgi:hypothetical protein
MVTPLALSGELVTHPAHGQNIAGVFGSVSILEEANDSI